MDCSVRTWSVCVYQFHHQGMNAPYLEYSKNQVKAKIFVCFFIIIEYGSSMIGIFDSGLWWVLTLQYFQKLLPSYNYMYLGDTLYLPYGEKEARWIHDRTFTCLNRLFLQWCEVVILACNTASAHAIKHRQSIYPHKKVLSITVPGVEALAEKNYKQIGILATRATISSKLYESVFHRLFPSKTCEFHGVIGTGLVDLIESGASDQEILTALEPIMSQFPDDLEMIILWCTHYPLIQKYIEKWIQQHYPIKIPLIDPSRESAKQFVSYLSHHPEVTTKISQWATARYLVTWDTQPYEQKIRKIFGKKVICEKVMI